HVSDLAHVVLSNVVVAALLAVLAWCVDRVCRRPALTHALWLLVLIKLVTPPFVTVPMPWPSLADDRGPPQQAPAPIVDAPAPVQPAVPPANPGLADDPPDIAPVERDADAGEEPNRAVANGGAPQGELPGAAPPVEPTPAVVAGEPFPWPGVLLGFALAGSAV